MGKLADWISVVWGALLSGALICYLLRALKRGVIALVSPRRYISFSKRQQSVGYWLVFAFYLGLTVLAVACYYAKFRRVLGAGH